MKNTNRLFIFCICAVFVFSMSQAANAETMDKVIAVVNNEVVTQREFDRAFIPAKDDFEANYKGEDKKEKLEEMRKFLLEQIINTKLAISLAKKEKIKIDETAFRTKVDTIKSYYPSEEEFHKALQERGTNLSEFKKEMREQMMAQTLVERDVSPKIIITPAEVSDLYAKNKDKLKTPPRAKVLHIMTKKAPGESSSGQARKKMNDILARLKKGEDFAKLAGDVSESPYASRSGDMDFVVKGQLLEPMDKAIFATAKGSTTDVVGSEDGFHIFKVEEIEEPRDLSLEEVDGYLRQELYKRKFAENILKWLEEKKKNAYICYK